MTRRTKWTFLLCELQYFQMIDFVSFFTWYIKEWIYKFNNFYKTWIGSPMSRNILYSKKCIAECGRSSDWVYLHLLGFHHTCETFPRIPPIDSWETQDQSNIHCAISFVFKFFKNKLGDIIYSWYGRTRSNACLFSCFKFWKENWSLSFRIIVVLHSRAEGILFENLWSFRNFHRSHFVSKIIVFIRFPFLHLYPNATSTKVMFSESLRSFAISLISFCICCQIGFTFSHSQNKWIKVCDTYYIVRLRRALS